MGSVARWNKYWIERRPMPLDLSDTEILDWMNENCQEVVYKLPTPNFAGGFTLKCYGVKTWGETLRAAVCLAAAKLQEEN